MKIANMHQVQYHKYPYLSGTAFLVNLTAPNRESASLNSVFKSLDLFQIHRQTKRSILILWWKVALFCFKQLLLNSAAIFKSWIYLSFGSGLLPVVRLHAFMWQSLGVPCNDCFSITSHQCESIWICWNTE